jgi:hypothetical protein
MYFAESAYGALSPAKMQTLLQHRSKLEKELRTTFNSVTYFRAKAEHWVEQTMVNYYPTATSTIQNEGSKVVTMSSRIQRVAPLLLKLILEAKHLKDEEYGEKLKHLSIFHTDMVNFCDFFVKDFRDVLVAASAIAKVYRNELLIPDTDKDLALQALETAMVPYISFSLPAKMKMFDPEYPPADVDIN